MEPAQNHLDEMDDVLHFYEDVTAVLGSQFKSHTENEASHSHGQKKNKKSKSKKRDDKDASKQSSTPAAPARAPESFIDQMKKLSAKIGDVEIVKPKKYKENSKKKQSDNKPERFMAKDRKISKHKQDKNKRAKIKKRKQAESKAEEGKQDEE
mmetsp:Transcript_30175/g.34548  ORF Transcript_30175/g.34548 Transcript_30175/m.34548 type:complete len:153 (-) Transcript_30175:41-499(-)